MSEQKTKLQLRPSFSKKSEKSPPPGKLFLTHGKPNYTIPRSPKIPKSNPMSPDVNEFEKVILKRVPSTSSSVNSDTSSTTTTPIPPLSPKSITPTTTPFGTLRATKPNLYNGNAPVPIPLSDENEVSRVVLRSTNYGILRNPPFANGNNAEPEFITRQRKIAGRLAQDENSVDIALAKKRSSYTEILSTPTINRNSQNSKVEKSRMSSIEMVEETKITLQNGNHESTIEPVDKAEIIAASAKPSAVLVLNENQEDSSVQHKPENFHNVIAELKQIVPELEPNEDVDVVVVVPEAQINSHNKEEENISTAKTNGDAIINGDVITNGNGTNFEPNTVVSFAKELSSEPNNYPDTVSTSQTIEHVPKDDKERETLEELAKLKFEIEENGQDVTVTQVLRTD